VITEQDLQEAIAECQGQRNPNANTCIKLAAFYMIRNELYGKSDEPPTQNYSFSPPPEDQPETYIDFNSDSEFSQVVNGMDSSRVWVVIDELMETLQVINPRLYDGVIRKLEEG